MFTQEVTTISITPGLIQLPVQIQPYILPTESTPQAVPYKLNISDWLSHWRENYEYATGRQVLPTTVVEYPQPGASTLSPVPPAPVVSPPREESLPSLPPVSKAGLSFQWVKDIPDWVKISAVVLGAMMLMRKK